MKLLMFLLNHRKKLYTGEEWARLFGIRVLDPDGWRHDNKPFLSTIDMEEFLIRVVDCTIMPIRD